MLIGRNDTGKILASAHVSFFADGDALTAFIVALGVDVTCRNGKAGTRGSTADALFRHIIHVAREEGRRRNSSALELAGNVHVRNDASQYACLRAGLEPVEDPVGAYQRWAMPILL